MALVVSDVAVAGGALLLLGVSIILIPWIDARASARRLEPTTEVLHVIWQLRNLYITLPPSWRRLVVEELEAIDDANADN